ncbi:hypothetical protein G3I34_21710 [Streptomyces sp. SID8014]|uniref:hypothetical protein n=1 Tax=Streptomyces sp. SID8014 TaxID=2706097 RepID=UPI0013BB1732|nr:hypothetical protein [Streptomyces sp. SID8014]NEC14834.1 hypothetical protein [Streptomyces sp. SID8014]
MPQSDTPTIGAVPPAVRQVLAEWIFGAYMADTAGLTPDQTVAVAAVGQAATDLHALLGGAGVDLSAELDTLSDRAARQAFSRYG